MSKDEDVPTEEVPELHDDETPEFEDAAEQIDLSEHVEPLDPLEEATQRAEKAEKEIAYKEAEIQNVRKRMMAEKATAIKYGSMGLSRRMIGVLDDFDRAINNLENDSSIADGFTLVRKKFWAELESEGLVSVGNVTDLFDPSKMEAIATIPASDEYPTNTVVEVLEKEGQGLNLTEETKEGILRHSKPKGNFLAAQEQISLESQICRLSDAIAYVNHDVLDALRAGWLGQNDLPKDIIDILGERHSQRVNTLVMDTIMTSAAILEEENPILNSGIQMSGEISRS